MNSQGILYLLILLLSVLASDARSQAIEDLIVVRKKNSTDTLKRRGRILDWKGRTLTLLINEKPVEFDSDSVISIKTQWPKELSVADQRYEMGDIANAIPQYQRALAAETRPWAKRTISARLVNAYMAADQPAAAAKQFLFVLQGDRFSRFTYLAPLPWKHASQVFPQAQQLLESDEPVLQLIGAAWSISGKNKTTATNVLDQLSSDIDPYVRSLAIAQQWKTRIKINPKQIGVWSKLIEQMPRQVRAGPRYLLAKRQFQAKLFAPAVLNWMKVVTLHPEQRSLVAASLFQAAKTLRLQNKNKQASRLIAELQTRHPQSAWTQQTNK